MAHCSCSRPVKLGYAAAVTYALSCAVYLLVTRCHDAPFLASLTPRQQQLRKESGKRRGCAFAVSVFLSALVLRKEWVR